MNKKILYFHGLSSSGATPTAKNIRRLFKTMDVIAPDIPIQPFEALSMLRELCEKEQPDLIIGTSMGGMFAQQMHGYKKILVNPAFHVSEIMRQNLGTVEFLQPREDGAKTYENTPQLCEQYEEMEKHQFEDITAFDIKNTFAYFGEHDPLVHCYDEYHLYYTNADWFPGEHRLRYSEMRDYMKERILSMIS
jgi:hypothetical protein